MLVEEAYGARTHQPRRDARRRRFEDEAAEFRNPLPVAVVAENLPCAPTAVRMAWRDVRSTPGASFDLVLNRLRRLPRHR
jgi:hypothetical protein